MTKRSFQGIYTALLSPMNDGGELDFASLDRLVDHQLSCGIDGFYAGGSTGEAFLLTLEERKQILEAVVRTVSGRAKVIAHVGCISTRDSIALAKHAEQAGADAISAVVPFYYKPVIQEIEKHYRSLMDAVGLPLLIYHFPGNTGVQLPMPFFARMAENSQCLGVKFTSLNLFEMQQIRALCGDDFLIMNGHDEVYAGGMMMGADGAIGSTFNMMPSVFTDMFAQAQSGDWHEVKRLQARANEVIVHMLRYDTIAYEKYMLYLQGVISNPTARQPLQQLDDAAKAEMERFYRSNETLRHNALQDKED